MPSYRWTVVFDTGRFSEFFDGYEASQVAATTAAVDCARRVRDARGRDFALHLRIQIETGGPGDKFGLSMALVDLDLDDEDLIARVDAGAAEESARAKSLQNAVQAAKNLGPTASPTEPSSVAVQLDRLRHALGSIGAPVNRGETVAIEKARLVDAYTWPDELIEFLAAGKPAARLTPYGGLYALGDAVTAREYLIESRDYLRTQLDYPELEHFAQWSSEPAGSPTSAFLDGFVPIAGDDSEYVIVDLRDGDLHGCVGVYQREGDVSGPTWVSISAMLSDLADSLESGEAFDRVWIPEVSESNVTWDAP
ncbi:hypothetical protein [Rhodococcoides kyotonense]|uniref:Cell wall assembly regulator SMI1 n=1 Tax=Rhodococcoides kyotonense TaxID=398843 RepID=A0A239MC15_9NOCA|nr:hypothetical protein [Rhodococcus kyotonensis]SNT40131.1 hypothetical protein SAMN05421642_11742 [Rhodococcus kyotonensis]